MFIFRKPLFIKQVILLGVRLFWWQVRFLIFFSSSLFSDRTDTIFFQRTDYTFHTRRFRMLRYLTTDDFLFFSYSHFFFFFVSMTFATNCMSCIYYSKLDYVRTLMMMMMIVQTLLLSFYLHDAYPREGLMAISLLHKSNTPITFRSYWGSR